MTRAMPPPTALPVARAVEELRKHAGGGASMAMDETARLLALIGDIYDAALDPTLWPRVVEKAGRFVGGSAASLFARDSVYKTGNSYYAFGVDPHYEKLYFEKYIKFDPLNAVYLTLAVGDVISNSNIVPHAEFIDTRFYKEWAQPQGWTDNVIASLEKSSTSIAAFVVFRHEREGLADDATRRLMRLIAPHLRRAVLIGKVVDLNKVEAATFAETLDGLGAGMFLVDETGRIVHANTAGRAILAADDFLRVSSGRLVARDPQTDRTLRDIFIAASNGDSAVGIQGIALPLDGAQRRASRSPHAAAYVRRATQRQTRLTRRDRRCFRAQGVIGNPIPTRSHREGLQADIDRIAGAARHRRGRRRSRGRRGAGDRGRHGQDAPWAPV